MLAQYYKNPKHSTSRESALRYKFLHDMKVAAARKGYDLKIYESDIDNEGSDVVLDDGHTIRKIQLKSLEIKGTTKTFEIHKNLLRPAIAHLHSLNFSPGDFLNGSEGAVILQVYEINKEEVSVKYEYFDLFSLYAVHWGITQLKGAVKKATFSRVITKLAEKEDRKIHIPRSIFLKSRSAGHLLALIGMSNPEFSPVFSTYFDIPDYGKILNCNADATHKQIFSTRIAHWYTDLSTNVVVGK